MIPLPIIQGYSTTHLTTGAAEWSAQASKLRESMNTALNSAHTLRSSAWQGSGGDGMFNKMSAHHSAVNNHADQLEDAARVANQGANTLSDLKQGIVNDVKIIEGQGFQVLPDYSVIDTQYAGNLTAMAARQPTAQAYSAQLKAKAMTFEQQEFQTATGIVSAANAGVTPAGWPKTPAPDWPNSNDVPPKGWPNDYGMQQNGVPFNPNWPVPATDFERDHHGSNFNPDMRIDTSTTTSSGDPNANGGGGRYVAGSAANTGGGHIQLVDNQTGGNKPFSDEKERGLLASFGIGFVTGGALGIESGPGALVSGLVGGSAASIGYLLHSAVE